MRWFKDTQEQSFLSGEEIWFLWEGRGTKLFFIFLYVYIKMLPMPASFHEVTGKRVCSRCWYTSSREKKKLKKRQENQKTK